MSLDNYRLRESYSSGFLVAALTLDIVHYVGGAAGWRLFYRAARRPGRDTEDVRGAKLLDFAVNSIFWSKLLCVGVGYFYLLHYVLVWALE
jgi:hypothetical protein